MVRRGAIVGAVLALLAGTAVGCVSPSERSVGETAVVINLGACSGEGTDCDPPAVESSALVMPALLDCEIAQQTVQVAWSVELPARAPENSSDEVAFEHLAVAGDGSAWVAGERAAVRTDGVVEGSGSVFVAHYGSDGELLGESELSFAGDGERARIEHVRVVSDSTGRAYAAFSVQVAKQQLGWREVEQFWIAQFAPDGSRVGASIPVEGLAEPPLLIAFGADDGLLAWGPGAGQGVAMGRLTADGRVAWTQRALRQTAGSDALGDAHGGTTLYGSTAEAAPGEATFSVARYDAAGNLVWDRALTGEQEPFVRMGGTASGELLMLGRALDGLDDIPAGVYPDLTLHRLDADGEPLWSTRVRGAGESNFRQPTTDADGNVYFLGRAGDGDGEERVPAVFSVDARGERCTRLDLDGGYGRAWDLVAGPGGELYLLIQRQPPLTADDLTTFAWQLVRLAR